MPDVGGITRIQGPFPWARKAAYSQAVVTGGLVHLAGQYGCDAKGDLVTGSFRDQAAQTFANIEAVLDAAGSSVESLVHLRTYLLRQDDYPVLTEVRSAFLRGTIPSMTLVLVPAFAFSGMLVEVEAVAATATATVPTDLLGKELL